MADGQAECVFGTRRCAIFRAACASTWIFAGIALFIAARSQLGLEDPWTPVCNSIKSGMAGGAVRRLRWITRLPGDRRELGCLMRSQLGSRTRLVALLRNPADRFYSAYNMAFNEDLNRKTSATAMALARGGVGSSAESRTAVTYESFAKSLDRLLLCAPTCAAEPNVVSMFFNYGLYADHLAKFAKHFGWDRLLVERSEDFYADSATIALRVLRFAGLAVDDTLAVAMRQRSLSKEKRNAGKLWGGQAYTGKLQRAERRKLQAWFAPHNRRLYALIGRDLGWELDGENASSTVEDWAPGHVNKPAMALGQVEALPRPQAREAQLRPEL